MKTASARDTSALAPRVRTLFFVLAVAAGVSACVKVTDEVKATFAPPAPGEVDNFAVRAPHGVANRDDLMVATVPRADGGPTVSARDVAASEPAMCTDTTAAAGDASASLPSNCLQDAGIR